MLVDNRLLRRQVNKAIGWQVIGIKNSGGHPWPGSELGKGTGYGRIQNTVARGLHGLVNVAIKNTT
jgi:hypothetical protein